MAFAGVIQGVVNEIGEAVEDEVLVADQMLMKESWNINDQIDLFVCIGFRGRELDEL